MGLREELAGLAELAGLDDLAGVELAGLDELAGVEDFAGGDDLAGLAELAGRIRRRLQSGSAGRAGSRVRQTPEGPARELVMPVDFTNIPAASTVDLTLNPQRTMRMQRLMLQSDVSPSLLYVVAFNVGQRSQFNASGGVPIAAFAFDAVGMTLKGDTATPGISVVLSIRNRAAAAAENISGGIFGLTVEQ